MLLSGLFASRMSASANEPNLNPARTSLGGTTVSGSVAVAITEQPAPTVHLTLWQKFLLWLRSHEK